jgi:hypothetical protein
MKTFTQAVLEPMSVKELINLLRTGAVNQNHYHEWKLTASEWRKAVKDEILKRYEK